jgi:hypothetical protein
MAKKTSDEKRAKIKARKNAIKTRQQWLVDNKDNLCEYCSRLATITDTNGFRVCEFHTIEKMEQVRAEISAARYKLAALSALMGGGLF